MVIKKKRYHKNGVFYQRYLPDTAPSIILFCIVGRLSHWGGGGRKLVVSSPGIISRHSSLGYNFLTWETLSGGLLAWSGVLWVLPANITRPGYANVVNWVSHTTSIAGRSFWRNGERSVYAESGSRHPVTCLLLLGKVPELEIVPSTTSYCARR